MATCSNSDDEFSSALVLCIVYTSKEYSDWKPRRNDCVVIILLLLHNDNKYGCVIVQNNGAMKIVNFMYAQTAKTRHSILRP